MPGHDQIHASKLLVARQKARALLGWLGHDEAIQLLLGHEPEPGEDLTLVEKMYDLRRRTVAKRKLAEIAPSTIILPENTWDLKARAKDPALHSALAGLDWSLQVVDLRRIIAYQTIIAIEGLEERIAPVHTDRSQLLELCIPSKQVAPPQNLLRDIDHKGFTISSLNPNLRVAGNQIRTVNIAPEDGMQPMPMLAVTFLMSMGTSFVKVATYQGRDFLRDGYHRATALLRHGINYIPCVYIKARTLEEVGGNRATSLHYDIIFGEHPPFLIDFWNDHLSATIDQLAVRRAVRITAEEFDIQG